jgi:hypothetical protein
MGFSISWTAFRGKTKNQILGETKFADTGEPDEYSESPVSGAELAGGWYVLFFNDVAHPLALPTSLGKLSQACEVISCQIEEHSMVSTASNFKNGQFVWFVAHNSSEGTYNIHTQGSLPPSFEAIQTRLKREQDEAGGEKAGVDCIFDVPIELAAAACGYRHDKTKFEWGEPAFTRLQQKSWWTLGRNN